MTLRQPTISKESRRRPSRLSRQLADEKIGRARNQTPEERLFYLGLCAWVLTRLDEEARDAVDARRERGDIIADYDKEVRKRKSLLVLLLVMRIVTCLAGIIFHASKLRWE